MKCNSSTHRKCKLCGEIKDLNGDNFFIDRSKKYGFGYGCKSCKPSIVNKIKRDRYFCTKNILEYAVKRTIKDYDKIDRYRGRDNNLTVEFVTECLSSPCTYCGFQSTGLDRIDNSIGHIISNCVPCCAECNISRMDNFTHEEMKLIGLAIKEIKLARIESAPIESTIV